MPPGTRWSTFHSNVLTAIEASPALTDFDWIIDDQGPMDDVDVAGMTRTGATFRRLSSNPNEQTFTVITSTDRFFATWALVINENYGNRRHYSAPTLSAAVLLLDRLTAERRSSHLPAAES